MGLGGMAKKVSGMIYSSVSEEAKSSLGATTAKKGDGKGEVEGGEYYTLAGNIRRASKNINDSELAEELWFGLRRSL